MLRFIKWISHITNRD